MADKIGSNDKESLLYLTQIQYLDKQLERCQLKCDELEKQNKDLVSQYSALEKDKKDITEYLKCSVVAKEKKVDELAERLESQERAAQQDQEALKLQHRQQIQQLQERINKLNLESLMQVAKFEEQQEQKDRLMWLLSDMEPLEKQLASQQEEHEAATYSLMMEAELEMEKIEERQDAVDDYVKKRISNILEEERAQHSERLEKFQLQLNENMDLWEEKDTKRDREKSLYSETNKLKKHLNEITQESLTRKTGLEKLTKKRQQLEVELKEQRITHQRMLAKEDDLTLRLASASEECHETGAEAGQLGAELQRERSSRRRLEAVMQEAAIILRNILEDSEKASNTHWNMQRLRELLERPTVQGTGPALMDSTEESSRGQKPLTSDPRPARAETLNLDTDPAFLMSRYRPGDLGFVPRRTWKRKPGVSRTDAPSSSTQLPLNRKKTSSSADPSDRGPAPQSV